MTHYFSLVNDFLIYDKLTLIAVAALDSSIITGLWAFSGRVAHFIAVTAFHVGHVFWVRTFTRYVSFLITIAASHWFGAILGHMTFFLTSATYHLTRRSSWTIFDKMTHYEN
jgi:hypothetical protein